MFCVLLFAISSHYVYKQVTESFPFHSSGLYSYYDSES